MIDLSVNLGKGVILSNPLLPASGTFGLGDEIVELGTLEYYGGIITKSLTLKPRIGNRPPRIAETLGGMINSIGLANPGWERFLATKGEFYKNLNKPIFINIAGSQFEEYLELVSRINDIEWITGIEVNVSCPNVKEGGIEFGKDTSILGKLVKEIRHRTSKYLVIKLTPNVTDIVALALTAEENGADAVSLINTLYGAAIDIVTRKPKIKNVIGGYSGPAIKPVAIANVIKVYRAVKIPIIGIGGIINGEDVVEFMLAGATAVQLGTVNFYNPLAPEEILKFLEEYCEKQGFRCLRELTGALLLD